jgi:hypothetical protein
MSTGLPLLRRRQVAVDRVEHGAAALEQRGCGGEDGDQGAAQRRGVEGAAHLVDGELGALEVLLQQGVVGLGGGVDERRVGPLHLGAHVLG